MRSEKDRRSLYHILIQDIKISYLKSVYKRDWSKCDDAYAGSSNASSVVFSFGLAMVTKCC